MTVADIVVCDRWGCCATTQDHRIAVAYQTRTGTWGVRTEHHWLAGGWGWVRTVYERTYYGDDKAAAVEAAAKRQRRLNPVEVGP